MHARPFCCVLAVGLFAASPAYALDDDSPPELCRDAVRIYEIQDATHVSPLEGEVVITCGVVTAVGFNSYYIQDPDGDGDDATSDGMFVFDSRTPPAVGELLRLEDRVEERIPGGASTGNLSTTQFSFPTILDRTPGHVPLPVLIGRDGRMPPNQTVITESETAPPINLQDAADADVTPFNPETDGIDFYESLEGMLVKVQTPVAVSAIRQFGTFSAEVFVLASDGEGAFPRRARTDRGGIFLQPDPDNRGDQNPERIQIQFDGTLFGSTSYPNIQVNDGLDDVKGVVGYSFGNYEVNAIGPVHVFDGHLEPERSRLRNPSRLRVASYNVLNLSAVDADDDQRNLVALHIAEDLGAPDIVALQEIQDDNGDVGNCPGDDSSACAGVLNATQTLAELVRAIEAAGGPTYAFFDVAPLVETTDDNRTDPDTFGGVSLGNIRNAFLYDPRRVRLVGFEGLTRDVLAARGVSVPRAFDTSRDPLEAVFRFRGQDITVINNHFSSRFGSTPIFGGPQPFVQAAEDAREAQSLAMNEVTRAHLRADPDARVVVLGDLNTFEFTNDLAEILPGTGKDRVLTNLTDRARRGDAYSFIFEGNSQALDHVFVSDALKPGARLDFVHVNVDFPRRFGDVVGSDHEPLLASLRVERRRERSVIDFFKALLRRLFGLG
ncbi:MAG: endonuclease/exonuclease/phosphatase family protein [Myxococcota bacterium]